MTIETNIFPFLNLSELSTQYRLYTIRGLKHHSEYYQNRQNLIQRLSYKLKHPVTIVEIENKPFLVVSANAPKVPDRYPIIRGIAYFSSTNEIFELDYSLRNPQNDEICIRFLHFMVQSHLFNHSKLWQPGAGKPFFEKQPCRDFGNISLFRGFSVRPTFTKDSGIGLCVDVQHKFVSKNPLPNYLNEQTFQQYKAKRCIYRFGHQWYEIQLSELSDLNVTEEMIPDGDTFISLLDYAISHSRKPIPQDLALVAQNSAVVHYFDNRNNDRAAIAALCHLVYGTTDPAVQKYHPHTVLKPDNRRSLIQQSVENYLQRISFGDLILEVSNNSEKLSEQFFTLPDYRFGNGHRLSVRGSYGSQQATLECVGKKRLGLLSDPKAGVYVQEPFERQYFLLPQTVGDSFGSEFIKDLKKAVDKLYPQGGGYDPQVFFYQDRGFRTYIEQGRAILETVELNQLCLGYGVVMLPDKFAFPHQHDLLAALVLRELKDHELYVATIHSSTGKECYESQYQTDGQPFYTVRSEKRGKLQGYLRNVALNKVLLTNERWPFVLATSLHADITIGIDVKHNTAGYIVVNKDGSRIWTLPPVTSKQKEQLTSEQIKTCLNDILTKELERVNYPISNIVIHRDGRMYMCEIEGVKQSINSLKQKGLLPENVNLTMLEISKSEPVSLRIFSSITKNKKTVTGSNKVVCQVQETTDNPEIGFHYVFGNDGYLSSTGKPFLNRGTSKPLHVKYIEGGMPFENCLEDIFYLTALAWTKPDDCSRYPITTKINDRRLGEDASEYDEDALRFDFSEGLETEENTDEIANNNSTNNEAIK
ncbi:Piwi domain-containing protein [Nodosilinea sp. PGN35]|uniref:Piwi domain-containing protein n=1 Tax=Nodosilinea sp. PGN35 TaxID=3020489 RepID=UPI00398B10B9